MYWHFCLHRAFDKIHSWKLFAYRKIFAYGKNKSRRKSLVKKKKKQSQRREEEYHSLKKRKQSFENATGINGALRWRPDFEQRNRVKTKFVTHKVKNKVSFYLCKYQS